MSQFLSLARGLVDAARGKELISIFYRSENWGSAQHPLNHNLDHSVASKYGISKGFLKSVSREDGKEGFGRLQLQRMFKGLIKRKVK